MKIEFEKIIEKHLPWFENRTAKNWDAEILMREFAYDILKLQEETAGQVEPEVVVKLAETLKTDKIEKDLEEYLTDKQVYNNYDRSFMLPDDAEIVAKYVGIFIRAVLIDIESEIKKLGESKFSE